MRRKLVDRRQTEMEGRATFVQVPASYFIVNPSYSQIFLSHLLLNFHVSLSHISIPLSSYLSIHPFAFLPACLSVFPSIYPSNYLFTYISIIFSSLYLSTFFFLLSCSSFPFLLLSFPSMFYFTSLIISHFYLFVSFLLFFCCLESVFIFLSFSLSFFLS